MNINNKITLFFILFLGFNIANAQEIVYSQVLVKVEDMSKIQRLVDLDFDIDHYEGVGQNSISFYVTSEEIQKLTTYGFSFDVTISNFTEYYKEQRVLDEVNMINLKKSENTANGFDLGSMGGFYTFEEVEGKLDEMKTEYPHLITSKISIGTSVEGRPIWMVKISDNPEINEGEPAAYFDGLHHSREPLSMATNINFMFWLLENYSTNTAVQFLVDHRELYFVPVVNPDGYAYNELTDPNGGGLWRKNRKQSVGGCIGVDLNRNYSFEFAHDSSCASNDPCTNTYHGTAPFSEPETGAIKDLLTLIEPNTGFSIHSTAGVYLMPYGYNTSPPDFEIYSEWASSFLNEADYAYGVTFQMLGYTSCGTTRDYLHSEGIYGWTPEIGGNGFWPQPSTIFDLVGENVRPLFYQSWLAGAYLDVQDHYQIGDAIPGSSFELVVEVKNIGVGATSINTSVTLAASDPRIQVPTANSYGDILARTRQDNSLSPFMISIDPSFNEPSFDLTITTVQNGAPNETAVVTIYTGVKDILFSDDAESGVGPWLSLGNGISWGIVNDDSYSGLHCFGDSNGGNSVNNTTNSFRLGRTFDLTTTLNPQVSFNSKYSLEAGDLVRFQTSIDGGNHWETLKTFQLNEAWYMETIDLSSYQSFSDVQFRFWMHTNNFIPSDGFYFDDFEISDYDPGILNINETDTLSEVIIHPNPFDNSLSILGISQGNATIAIYDAQGRKLKFSLESANNGYFIVGLDALTAGIYFLKIENTAGEKTVRKIIKE
jgi:carboxypeptidase T